MRSPLDQFQKNLNKAVKESTESFNNDTNRIGNTCLPWENQKKIVMYKVIPGKGCNPCCEKEIKSVCVWLEEAEVGDELKIEVIEMTENEYNELPEYMGP